MTDTDDLAYDDGSETEIETDADDPPRSGSFVDHDDVDVTEDELAEGERLGQAIDVDDDHDNGLAASAPPVEPQPATPPPPVEPEPEEPPA